ncbi:MAG: DUF481 domain-containing protein, partial [Myxococcota bacterium]
KLSIGGGMNWHTNEANFIDDRFTFFLGVASQLLQEPTYQLRVGLYSGYEDLSFRNDKLDELMPGLMLDDYESFAVYIEQSLSWQINEQLMLTESANHLQYFDGDGLFRSTVNLSLSVALTKTISMVNSFILKYDKNRLEQSVVEALQGYEPLDIHFTIGVQLSL